MPPFTRHATTFRSGHQPDTCLLSLPHCLKPYLSKQAPIHYLLQLFHVWQLPQNNIWSCHVSHVRPAVGVGSDWVSEWLTGLIHRPAHLVKEVSGGRFPPPTSTQTNTTRRTVKKRPVSATVCPRTDLDIYLARSSVFSLQIITIFMRTMENKSCFKGCCVYIECCFNVLMVHLEHKLHFLDGLLSSLYISKALQRTLDKVTTKFIHILDVVGNCFTRVKNII